MLNYFKKNKKETYNNIMDDEIFNDNNNEQQETCDSFEASVLPEPCFTPVASCEVILPELNDEQIKKEEKLKSYRGKLILALLGLILSPFYGSGFIFSLIGFIMSVKLAKSTKSTTIRWALTLSIIGLAINIAVFLILSIYLRTAPPIPAEG